jgi:hypothetical protein
MITLKAPDTSPGIRLTFPQWRVLRWLSDPRARVRATNPDAYMTMPDLVRLGCDGRWRSTAAGRKAVKWAPIWSALDHAATSGTAFLPMLTARCLSRWGIVDLISDGPLESRVRLTPIGRAMVEHV